MKESEVYSWRVPPLLKASLEDAARRERSSVAKLLERIVGDHLRESRAKSDDEEQERIRARVRRLVGAISGNDPTRSSRVSELVRARLMRKHAR
jgi:hypothetical protein